jgi:chitodextrinase
MVVIKHKLIGLVIFLVALGGCAPPNQLPTVKITSPQEGVLLGSTVEFHAEASDPDGSIESYLWDFGDGNKSDGPQPTHKYTQSGEYNVKLTVTDDRGAVAQTGITIKVQVGPKAIATVRQAHVEEEVVLQYLSGEAPLTVAFDGSRSVPEPGTQITEFHWDFGDGNTSDKPQPVHIYTQGGEYQVTLTVTDDRGRTDQAQVVVQVVAYEAIEETLRLGELTLSYRLYHKASTQAAAPSMIYKYVVESPRPLTEEEIRAVLEDIVEKAKARPRVGRIMVHLFTQAKENFMIPGDYDHYLGSITWDRIGEGVLSFAPNRSYLEGKALTVLGYEIREDLLKPEDPYCGQLCELYRIGLVEIYIRDEPICKGLLLKTLREIVRWRLSAAYNGYLVNIYSGEELKRPIAWAMGVRPQGELAMDQLPIAVFAQPPERWDVKEGTLWVSLGQVPPCELSP